MEQSEKNNFLINIKIKTLNGSLYEISANPQQPLSSIQNQIQNKTGVPLNGQRLIFKGVLLQFQKTFHFYKIQEGHVIQLIANRIPSELSSKNSSNHRSTISRANVNYSRDQYKYKKYKYIQQRINGFKMFNNSQVLQVLAQNKHTIDQLFQCINLNGQYEVTPFKLQKRYLQTGEWVDIRDASGQWVEGQIINHYGQYVHIHFSGYSDRWNQWIPVGSQRIMPFRTYTVQSQKVEYMSPFPVNSPKMRKKDNKNFQPQLQKFISDLTLTIDNLQFDEKSQKDQSIKNVSTFGVGNNANQLDSSSKLNEVETKLHHQLSQKQQKEKSQKQYKKQQFQTPSKDHPILADNLSNKCQDNDNISNKCDNDDISNKSFKSKRSEGLVDTSSMKSLIIDQHRHKQKQNKIFFDYSQAQSVRSMKNKNHSRCHYINHQPHILEQQDSQNNEDLEDLENGHLMLFQKMLLQRKMKASQLAPMLDRLGRLLIDLAPQVAMLGYTEQVNFQKNQNNLFNQNLSTFTNEGSLQSRLLNLQKRQRGNSRGNQSFTGNNQHQQEISQLNSPSQMYCQFQIPVMLTPGQITRINRLLQMETIQMRNNLNS